MYISIFKLSIPNTKNLNFKWQKIVREYNPSIEETAECKIKLENYLEKIKKEKNIIIFFSTKELKILFQTHPHFSQWSNQIKFDLENGFQLPTYITKYLKSKPIENNLNVYYKLNLNTLPILKYVPYLRNRSFYGKLETKPIIYKQNIALILKQVYWNNEEHPTSLFGNLYQFQSTKKIFENIKSIQITSFGIQLISL
ncbi:MAG: hypothetical protein COA79_11150 [Planctomycetota bacterium]|nr:MAG: hypothetical protein COA79_11150 [Planctomycetota bacterium]